MNSPVRLAIVTAALVAGLGVSNSVIRGTLAQYSSEEETSATSYIEVAGRFLGPLRPLLVDFLWLRAIDAQDEKRYYEAYTLSIAILRLEPRYTPVWEFAGWNLAYNISWDQVTPDDRFRWIMNGTALLGEAVRRNPDSVEVYSGLAHTYAHRLSPEGGDPFQRYFEEYLSPPAFWASMLGLRYAGESLMLDNHKEMRLYGGLLAGGQVNTGEYPPPESKRAPLPYAVLYKPDAGVQVGERLAKLEAGANLWEGSALKVVEFPETLKGVFIYRFPVEECRKGFRLELPGPGKLWVAFPTDRMECYRLAAEVMEAARKRIPLMERGMSGLNLERDLAHTYEKMGRFAEAEKIWQEIQNGVEPRFREGVEYGVRNFYQRVLEYYKNDAVNTAVWTKKKDSATAKMRYVGNKPGSLGEENTGNNDE
jgi:hypothetical protein